jgi:hypothetical protein
MEYFGRCRAKRHELLSYIRAPHPRTRPRVHHLAVERANGGASNPFQAYESLKPLLPIF